VGNQGSRVTFYPGGGCLSPPGRRGAGNPWFPDGSTVSYSFPVILLISRYIGWRGDMRPPLKPPLRSGCAVGLQGVLVAPWLKKLK